MTQKVHWVIQNNLIKEELLQAFREVFQKHTMSYEEVTVIPFSDVLPSIRNPNDFCLFYGSTTLMLNAYQKYSPYL